MQNKILVIKNIREEITGFKTFEFEPGHGISYKAGQYLTFVYETNGVEIRRSYSITSSPELGEPLTIGVKRIPNGAFSRALIDNAKEGDRLYTTGAGGFFTLPENVDAYRQIFFFAAGSGITPIYALIKTCLHLHPHLDIVLVYSNASINKTIFYQNLVELKFYPRFRLQFLFSDSADLRSARLNRELMASITMNERSASLEQTLYYICGPEAYMRMCTYTLQEAGVPKENIRRENFSIEKLLPSKSLPPDTDPHTVTIRFNGEQFIIPVRYPQTILAAAKKLGIGLPYSCETGRCGSCASKCISGKVWLSHNEVLTDKELLAGITLTCVGYPVGGDVVLDVGGDS